jgi:hypothetical protein
MVKKFAISTEPILSRVIDTLAASLNCSKYRSLEGRVEVVLASEAVFQKSENRELAGRGFGTSLFRIYTKSYWEVAIVIHMENCRRADLSEREVAAVVLHELGHILNEPEFLVEPTFEFCFINGTHYNREVLEETREANSLQSELFADAYASRHGYGSELISTFNKQNSHFEQQIGYCSARIEKILKQEYLEGTIFSPR